MGKIVKYVHHDRTVFVDEDLKGKYRGHCLCHRCSRFLPNTINNCHIAQSNYENCVKYGIVTPVYECPSYASINEYLANLP